MTRVSAFFVSVFVASILVSAAQVSRRESTPSYTERYGVLWERNIFVRDRTRPTTGPGSIGYVPGGSGPGSASTTQITRTDPEHSIALRGVVFEDDAYRAYVENTSSGVLSRLSLGDAVARGKVDEIALDGISYRGPGGQKIWIVVGDDLSGEPAITPVLEDTTAAPTTTASTMPSGVEGLNPNDPTLTMEQRMKLKRMTELKGK